MFLALHIFSSLSLLIAAILLRLGRKKAKQFLLPFTLLSFLSGIALTAPFAMEIFIANYSGAIYETEQGEALVNALLWPNLLRSAAIPMLPGLALFPLIRNRPLVVAALALSALLTSLSWI